MNQNLAGNRLVEVAFTGPLPRPPGRNGLRGAGPEWDRLTGDLAAVQHGLVARRQLLEMGMSENMIDYRIARGRLCVVHPGVYRSGPVLARLERQAAALLAAGAGAVLSHASAGFLWGLVPGPEEGQAQDVTVRHGWRRGGRAANVRHFSDLRDSETTRVERLPVTDPARTIFDLAASIAPPTLERALAKAEREGLANRHALAALLKRHPRRRGARRLRILLGESNPPAFIRSEAEARMLELLRRARLPKPAVNARVAGLEVDFFWRRERLIAEIDGFAFHGSRDAFEHDRSRDAHLLAAGYRVFRATWRQLRDEPEAVLVRLAQALARLSD